MPAAATNPKPHAEVIRISGDPVAGQRRIRIDTPGSKIPVTNQVAVRHSLVTPGTVVLLALMVFFGMYSTGNLPEFDRWTSSLVNTTQAKNDVVVASFENMCQYIAIVVAIGFVGFIWLLIHNHRRTRHNADGDYDFTTR